MLIPETQMEPGSATHVVNIHGESNFKYHHCDKSYTQKVNLKRNILGVHYGLGFVCQFCDFITTRKDSLKRHNERKHRNTSRWESSRKTIRYTFLNRTKG